MNLVLGVVIFKEKSDSSLKNLQFGSLKILTTIQ